MIIWIGVHYTTTTIVSSFGRTLVLQTYKTSNLMKEIDP